MKKKWELIFSFSSSSITSSLLRSLCSDHFITFFPIPFSPATFWIHRKFWIFSLSLDGAISIPGTDRFHNFEMRRMRRIESFDHVLFLFLCFFFGWGFEMNSEISEMKHGGLRYSQVFLFFFFFFFFFANSSISANYCLVRWKERNWLHRLVRGNGRHVSHSRFHFVVEWSVFDDLSLWTALITQGSDRGSGGRDSNISTKSETDHIE